jgi:EAL domain-containing protein (putative c-di-GMP-specific phosphodiesterase class I)
MAKVVESVGSTYEEALKNGLEQIGLEEEKVTIFGLSASYVHALVAEKFSPKKTVDLSHLRAISQTGSALSDDGFEIFYQPQFITGTDKLFGMEALVRLKNNIAGPGEFIPVAEENMSIIKIDRIVTHKTIKQIGEWLGKGYNVPSVSINFSNLQLSDRGYPNYVFEKLSSYNIDPSYIVIEITESSFLTTSSATTDYFNQFTEGGIRLSIDDYGTGYSSLSYLNRLPFSCLKIDQSLIRTEPTKENLFMIEKIVEIAHSRHYKVVAEGVETSQQEEFLKSIGCDATQGFMRGKPMRAEDIEKILART